MNLNKILKISLIFALNILSTYIESSAALESSAKKTGKVIPKTKIEEELDDTFPSDITKTILPYLFPNNIIIRLEGRNPLETKKFNDDIKKKIALSYETKDGNFFSDIDTKHLTANVDFTPDIDPKLLIDSFTYGGLAFPVEFGYKYIIRYQPCNKDESNAKLISTGTVYCIQKIKQLEDIN